MNASSSAQKGEPVRHPHLEHEEYRHQQNRIPRVGMQNSEHSASGAGGRAGKRKSSSASRVRGKGREVNANERAGKWANDWANPNSRCSGKQCIIALHPERGLLAVSDEAGNVYVYKRERSAWGGAGGSEGVGGTGGSEGVVGGPGVGDGTGVGIGGGPNVVSGAGADSNSEVGDGGGAGGLGEGGLRGSTSEPGVTDSSSGAETWQLADVRDLPARTGVRSFASAMEFSPEGDRLTVVSRGRNATTTFRLNPESGCIIEQTCCPPAPFKV